MAQRRMIDKDLVSTQAFTNMTAAAQAVYFRLCVFADDEGFVGNPLMLRAGRRILKSLEENGYIFCFKSGVVLIRHWHIHNKIRKDTFKETIHKAEKALVLLDSDKIYGYVSVTEPLRARNESVPQERLDKDSVGKDRAGQDREEKKSIEKDSSGESSLGKEKEEQPADAAACGASLSDTDKEDLFLLFWDSYPKKTAREQAKQTFMGINEDFAAIMEGLEYNKKSNQWVSDNGYFIPDPHNWLKRKGWNDRPPLYQSKPVGRDVGGAAGRDVGPVPYRPSGSRGELGPEELAAIRRAVQEADRFEIDN